MERTIRTTPERHGKILGHLEQDILEVLWAGKETTGRNIFAEIKRTRDIALTTVLTVLDRLAKKGIVKKVKGDMVYLFRPACTKEEFAREVSQDVLKDIFEISTSGAAASFVDMLADADPAELDRLFAIIEKKKKELDAKK
ncbi:MAG: BlaI/MecI/CopY family transcriptional regulator [Deltaproteobacteria bacterium]|nr:BlaI/MecI/CopY family transcriptional regulator [Deltaproteobacteria bacterium]MBI5810140.1 BlaI/MecI/CopY family transcriptional regulator [Deltaproteobacteria bacterium]